MKNCANSAGPKDDIYPQYVSKRRYPLANYVVFDIETVGRSGVGGLIPEPTAPGNIKDPAKIEAALEAKRAEQLDRLGLDMNLNRIVALGMQTAEMSEPAVYICENENDERYALASLWSAFTSQFDTKAPLIGFFCKRFDLPVCLRRTQLLGMPEPHISTSRYRNTDIIDLHELLTFDLHNESGVMKRSLKSFCELFGVPAADDCDGSDIAELVAAGNWDAVVKHAYEDVKRTHALAQKLEVI